MKIFTFVLCLLVALSFAAPEAEVHKEEVQPAPFISLMKRMIHRSLGDDRGCAPYVCKPTLTGCCAKGWADCMSGCRSNCLQNAAGLYCCDNIYPYGEMCSKTCPKC